MGKKLDLVNQIFGKLTVLREVPRAERKNDKIVEWECKCECGTIIRVRTSYLTSGHTKSCGCYRAESMSKTMSNNISHQRFGKLIALEPTKERASDGSIMWKCQCDCGNITYVNTHSLKTGAIQSCGCQRSRGESKINQLLFNLNLNYQTQFWYKDLKDKTYLYFDFAILDNDKNVICLIEYQGEQHYSDVAFFNKKYHSMDITKKHDQMKKEYCQKNNIRLIEIPYYDFNKLNEQYILDKIN